MLHLLVVGMVLASSALGAYRFTHYLPTLLLVLMGGAIGIVLLRWPALGILGLIPAALLVPFAVGTGTGTSINAAILLLAALLGLWIFDMVVRRRRIHLVPSYPQIPLLVFILVSLLSFGAGQFSWLPFANTAPLPAQVGGLLVFILSAGAFLLVANQVKDLVWLERLTWVFLVLGSVYVAGRLLPVLGRVVLPQYQSGAFGSLFWLWLAALTFSQALLNKDSPFWGRLGLILVVLGTFYQSFIQGQAWTSGWLPALVALGVILFVARPRLALFLTLAGIAGWFVFNQQLRGLVMTGDNPYSLMTRLEAWKIVLEIVKANPILGLGPANYRYYTTLFPILGYYVPFNSHNNYVDILAQIGLLGLGCFIWFAWSIGRLGWRLSQTAPAGFPRAYAVGALGGLVGTLAAGMLGDWVLPFVYNVGLNGFRASLLGWLFLGGLVVIEQNLNHQGGSAGEDGRSNR